MSYTTIQKLEDFDFIIQDYIYLSGKEGIELDKEIYNNFWQIMFSPEIIKDLSLYDLQDFMYRLFQKRTEQIREMNIENAVFYVWVEDLTRQLCFNIISGKNVRPPFGCTLNIINSPDPILKKFLAEEKEAVEKGRHLLFEDMIILERGQEGFDELHEKEFDPKEVVLDLYVTNIPCLIDCF